jgi:hypothetical protein
MVCSPRTIHFPWNSFPRPRPGLNAGVLRHSYPPLTWFQRRQILGSIALYSQASIPLIGCKTLPSTHVRHSTTCPVHQSQQNSRLMMKHASPFPIREYMLHVAVLLSTSCRASERQLLFLVRISILPCLVGTTLLPTSTTEGVITNTQHHWVVE